MTVTAGTVQKPGNTGLTIKKFFDFLAGNNNQRGKVFGQADASNVTTTTANETGQAIDLADEGFTFLADTLYKITFRSIATNANSRWIQVWEQYLLGGTTPVLIGEATLLTAYGINNGTVGAYGRTRYHGTTSGATTTNGADRSAGHSLGNFASGVATLTIPKSRATARCVSTHFSEDAGTIGDFRDVQVRSASATTMTVNVATVNGTEALTDPAGTNNIDLGLYILPPPSITLTMNGNNCEVIIGHDTAENVRHAVDVWVEEDPTSAPFAA